MSLNTPIPRALAVALLLAAAFGVRSAGAAETALVTAQVDDARRTTLSGHGVVWARTANDRGAVPSTASLPHLRLALKRSPERQQAFDAYLREQRDPASPNYQRWLTPSEIGERFGAAQSDIDAVSEWLRSQGLTVDSVANNRLQIQFSGSAAAVSAAFRTELRYFEAAQAEKRMAPTREPQIPSALAGAVEAVLGLSPARFRPQHRPAAVRSAELGSPRPALTNCNDQGQCEHYVTPGDFAKIYNLPSSRDGTGQTIAILGRARVHDADIQNFGARTNVTMRTPTVIVPPDGVDPGPAATTCSTTGGTPSCDDPSDLVKDQGEATLDVTRAGSVAPGAQIKLIVSGHKGNVDGLNYALDYAIDHEPLVANIISISFGTCEADNSQAVANGLDQLFAQGAMQGQSIFVSSGDAGAADCADYFTAPTADLSRSTNILCSSGHVTCVGGTSFGLGTDQYWSNNNAAGFVSATGYIPEGAWNEPYDHTNALQVASTGGGVSVYVPKPSWQSAPGVPGTQGRYVPDVSFGASVENGYFGCMAASQGSCAVGSNGFFNFVIWGGTSASAPSMAGVAAMLNQNRGAAQGNLNPTLYALGANSANGVFHDVTVQSSGVGNCSVGTASLCNNSLPSPTSLSGGLQGYLVGPGYDLATGLGSIDVSNLLRNWQAAAPAVNLNQFGLTGSWTNLATLGQGLELQFFPDFHRPGAGLLFGGWFTYDVTAAGGQRWYVLQGDFDSNGGSVTTTVSRVTGGRFGTGPSVDGVPVGTATLRFGDCMSGVLDYAFSDGSGRSGQIPLSRALSNVSCSAQGDTATASSDHLLSGLWYDAAVGGQGLMFEVNPQQRIFFGGWYTFLPNGQPGNDPSSQRWLVLQGAYTPGARTIDNVSLSSTSGGVFDSPPSASNEQVGTATVAFQSCDRATVTYRFTSGPFSGQRGTKQLSRLGPAPSNCRF